MQHNNLQDRGVVQVASFASALTSPPEVKCQKDGNFANKEPMSVLDTRSPSPSTSSSTLSSPFDGINGDKLTNLLVVGSDKDDLKRNVSLRCTSETAAFGGSNYNPEEEFAAELESVPAGLELNRRGVERLNFGFEEWEGFLSESAVHDQSIFRWVSGDSDDSALGLKQLWQGGNSSNQVENNANYVSGYEGLASGGSAGADGGLTGPNSSPGSLVPESSLCSNGEQICSVPNSVGLSNCSENIQKQKFSASPKNSSQLQHQDSSVAHQTQFQFDPKSEIRHQQGLVNQLQPKMPRNLSLLSSVPSDAIPEQPQAKRHNPGKDLTDMDSGSQVPRTTFLNQGNELHLKKAQNLTQLQQIQVALGSQLLPHNPQQKPPKQEVVEGGTSHLIAPSLNQYQHQEVVYEQLYKAIELTLAGNFPLAQVILSRLNHQLSPFAPVVKPFYRSCVYLMEALQFYLLMPNSNLSQSMKIPSPFDAMIKMGAYKMLSEVSPFIRFKNFTSNQALFEAVGDEESIHIIDFDIGMGDEWSSFMQDLPRRNKGFTSLKITAFASPSTHHPFEISLIHESLNDIATNVGINFQLEVVNFDTFEPSAYAASSFRSSPNEAVAVSFPIWSCSSRPSVLPSLLCFIKHLSPKAIVLFDRGCERYDLPPTHHLLHALQYYEVLLESIDAANMALDSVSKIEKFLLQPKIENIVCGRLHSPNIMPPFTNLLASAGFSHMPISSFSEAQAGWVVKQAQGGDGFHVEKRQAHTSLVLCWQRKELLSASVWKC